MNFHHTFKSEPVTFCGQNCFVREWSASDREHFETLVGKAEQGTIRAIGVVLSLVDADGVKLCSLDQVKEVAALPFSEVIRMTKLVEKVNSLGETIEQLEKN